MRRELTEFEHLLVELVHFLAYGSDRESGLTLRETKRFLTKPIESKDGRNALQVLESEKRRLIRELEAFLSNRSGRG